MNNVANILTVARREFTVRASTRSFRIGTVVLALGVLGFAFVPLIIQYIDRGSSHEFALYVGAADVTGDPAATLDAVLNNGNTDSQTKTNVVSVNSVDTATQGVQGGTYTAALTVERSSSGDLKFDYYSNDTSSMSSLRASVVQQAAQAIAIADRLGRLGITPADQASLFAPADYTVAQADATKPKFEVGTYLVGFGLTLLIFMMIVLYGTWIAQSVVEEKSSRVMEVVLNAATPFQLLGGKVLGVGAVAFVQYAVVVGAAVVALIAQGPLSERLLGTSGGGFSLPEGFNAGVLVMLGIYGVLGFLLYAVLYAAAASLINRQEDVQQVNMPMVLIGTAGYLVAVYGATGLLDVRSPLLTAMAQIPFFSPFMMLARIAAGQAALWEIPVSVGLLIVTIPLALWLAARVYAAGVLLYGQRPSLLRVWRVIRTGN
jgi:ABC-2 type transport system permease protein